MAETDDFALTACVLAARGDIDGMRAALELACQGPDASGPEGVTPLAIAARTGQLEVVKQLLEWGADAARRLPDGTNALIHAAQGGNLDVITVLLAAGAPTGVRDELGRDARGLAAGSGHAAAARLIREREWAHLVAKFGSMVERLGGRMSFDALYPASTDGKTGVFFGGTPRLDKPDPAARADTLDASAVAASARSMPLRAFDGWLKQVEDGRLDEIGRLALEEGFPHFASFMDSGPEAAHALLHRLANGVTNFTKPIRARRFAGDETLPRGYYHAICHDAAGDDRGTLVGELMAYCDIHAAGLTLAFDTTLPIAVRQLGELGVEPAAGAGPQMVLVFHHAESMPSAFGRRLGLQPGQPIFVVIPLTVRRERIERVLDLRQPDAAEWFAHHFSRWATAPLPGDGANAPHAWFPFRPPAESLGDLLPTMLSQERGGGLFHLAVGSWLRQHGVEALIFPSARNDCGVSIQNGRVEDWSGWNLVDYRGAGLPFIRVFFDSTNFWEERVRTGVGLGVSASNRTSWDPFEQVVVSFERSGPSAGSWRARGIVSIAQSIMSEAATRASEPDNPPLPRWVRELSLGDDGAVLHWVAAFARGNYERVARDGIEILGRTKAFEAVYIFIAALQRVGAGDECTQTQLGNLAVAVTRSYGADPVMGPIIGALLGGPSAPASFDALEPGPRGDALFCAGNRLLAGGDVEAAVAAFEGSIQSRGQGLGPHLALEELFRLGR